MAAIYVPVRLVTLILCAIYFITTVLNLVNALNDSNDNVFVAQTAITAIVLFLGAYGSYQHDRRYLTTFALILIIVFILNFFTNVKHYAPLGISLVLLLLALTQAELIKRGYH